MTTDAHSRVDVYVAGYPDRDAVRDDVTAEAAVSPRERQAILQLTQRLYQRFPHVAPDKIDTTIHALYHHFDHSRIRDFIPIFVERSAGEEHAALPTC